MTTDKVITGTLGREDVRASKLEQTRVIVRARTRRRDVHDLVVAILTFARTERKKTHIISKIGLSYPQCIRYLECLKRSGFIAERSGLWKTTDKGRHVIQACDMCRQLAHEFNQ